VPRDLPLEMGYEVSMTRLKLVRLCRGAALGLMLCGLIGFVGSGAVWYVYYDTLPRSPQPATGRIYALNMHGVALYATSTERRRLDMLENISFIIGVIGGVAATLMNPGYRRRMGWRSLEEPRARVSGPSETRAG